MKRTERHHLKENELENLAVGARHIVEGRGKELTYVIAGIVVVLVALLGYYGWTSRTQGRAHTLLADAMTIDDARVGPPPAPGSPAPGGLSFPTVQEKYQAAQVKFKAVADQYPGTDAGLFARYREAGTWMALGNAANAVTAFQQVVDKGGNGLYGQMARLGLAEAQAQAGQYDQAIAALKDFSQRKDGPVPADGVLMRLARVYTDAGKTTEAVQTLNQLVDGYPDSPFAVDARRALGELKKAS